MLRASAICQCRKPAFAISDLMSELHIFQSPFFCVVIDIIHRFVVQSYHSTTIIIIQLKYLRLYLHTTNLCFYEYKEYIIVTKEVFSKRLKELRLEQKITQKELASELGVSMGSIGFYENQERTPDIEFLMKASDYFGVSTEYLLGRTDHRTPDLDIGKVLEITGLSNESLEILAYVKEKYSMVDETILNDNDTYAAFCEALNDFISNGGFISLIMHYKNYIIEKRNYNEIFTIGQNGETKKSDLYFDRMVIPKYKCEEQFRRILERSKNININSDKELLNNYLTEVVRIAEEHIEIMETEIFFDDSDDYIEAGDSDGNDPEKE